MFITRFLKAIIDDPIRKIFAIIFAFGVWLFVAVESNYTYTREAKLMYTGLPDSLTVVDPVQTIQVTFSGRGRSLLSYWIMPPKVICNLAEVKTGGIRIHAKDLIIPTSYADVTVSYALKTIDVTIDEKIMKPVKITIPLKGTTRIGYSVGTISVLDTIEVIGPKGYLRNLAEVMTESMDLKNRNVSIEQKLKLVNPSPAVKFTKEYVTARIEIDTTSTRSFTDIPLKIVSKPQQNIAPGSIYLDTLIIAGARSRIRTLKRNDFEIVINLVDLSVGEYYLPAEIVLPDYVKPVYSSPKKFKIKIY